MSGSGYTGRDVAIPEAAERALEAARGRRATPSEIDRLSREVGPDVARWAFTQWQLRERAAVKFARAAEMLFDRDGLEMASHERVAALHASRFPAGRLVLDVGCGIGADLIALAGRGPVVGYERDPDRAAFARHNLAVHGLTADVRTGDGTEAIEPGGCVFLDPARRSGGRRAGGLDDYAPDPRGLLDRLTRCDCVVLKLSPMLPDAELESFGGRLEFLSHRGECPEALVTRPGEGRWAVHVETEAVLPAAAVPPLAEAPGAFVHEADPAAVRAHALGSLGLEGLGDSNGYLTSGQAAAGPWLSNFRVVWSGAFRPESVRRALRAEDGRVEAVKVRGVKADPAAVAREVGTPGSRPLVLLLYPVASKVRAVLAKRV